MATNDALDQAAMARRWTRAEAEREALLRLARRMGLGQADAEDCVQDAILKVVPRVEVDEERLGALLSITVKHRAIDVHRHVQARTRAAGRLRTMTSLEVEPPEVAVCDRAEAAWTAGVVQELPEFQRQVLAARTSGKPWADIATDFSTSLKSVESAVSRARAAVRMAIASTLGVLVALGRRLRGPATAVAAGTASVALVLSTGPLVLHGAGPKDDARTPSRAGVAAMADAANALSARPVWRVLGDGGGGGSRGAGGSRSTSSEEPPSRTRTIATVPTPVGEAKVTETEQDTGPFTRAKKCALTHAWTATRAEDPTRRGLVCPPETYE